MPSAQPVGRHGFEAVDPDVDLHVSIQRREWSAHRWVLPVIALGGMLGSSARYAVELTWPPSPDSMPWATFATNVTGCLLIGVLMVQLVEVAGAHPLVRPFIGVGVLGGYTTFSTYSVQTSVLITEGRPFLALVYLFGTLAVALAAVAVGVFLTRSLLWARRRMANNRKGSS